MNEKKTKIYFFLGLIAILTGIAFYIFRPYFSALLLAATIAVIVYPLHKRILLLFPSHESVAALLTTLIVLVIVVGPVAFIGVQVFQEARDFYVRVSYGGSAFLSGIDNQIQLWMTKNLPFASGNLRSYLGQIAQWLAQNLGSVFSGIGHGFVTFFFSMLSLYYLLRDGEHLKKIVLKLSPLPDHYDEEILNMLGLSVVSVIRGTLLIALIQGALTGIGFSIFGVPNATFWGALATFAALIPSVGTSLIIVPAIIYVWFFGDIPSAIGLSIWGVVAVGLIDNFLGPKLIGSGTRTHPLLILFSVLGGLSLFGPIGFIAGPLVVTLLTTLVKMYPMVVSEKN